MSDSQMPNKSDEGSTPTKVGETQESGETQSTIDQSPGGSTENISDSNDKMETDEHLTVSVTSSVDEASKQIDAEEKAMDTQNLELEKDKAEQKEAVAEKDPEPSSIVEDVDADDHTINKVGIETDSTDDTTAQPESTVQKQSENQSVSTNDTSLNIDQQPDESMHKDPTAVSTTTTEISCATASEVPSGNEDVASNDTSRLNIPAAVAEIAMLEMQQFERINAANPPSATPPAVIIAPKLSSSGLGLLASQYDSGSEDDDADSSSSSSDDESDSDTSVREIQTTPAIAGTYRTGVIEINSESDGNSSDSDVEFVKQSKELEKIIDIDMPEDEDYPGGKSRGPIRAKGELMLDELPPIQDLYITVPETECVVLGKVHSIVEQLVLVDSIPGTAALNLETVLFLDKGAKVLGEVFDVLGQVSEPLYCVRFNSAKQIKERDVEVGQAVYIAPRTEHTHFIILKDMMKLRGSDASWENDVEPTERHLDYSDDEEERSARRALRNRDRGDEEVDTSKRQRPAPSPSPQPQQHSSQRYPPRHQQYQRPQNRYRSEQTGDSQNRGFYYPNYNPRQQPPSQYPPPFAYGSSNASWHANYNQQMPPPPYQQHGPAYPYPYNPHFQQPPPMQRMPFTPPPDSMHQSMYPPPPPQ